MAATLNRCIVRVHMSSNKIKAWLEMIGRDQKWLAEELDKTQGYVSVVATGRKTASPEVAFKIEDLSGGMVTARSLIFKDSHPLARPRARAA